MVNAIEVSTNPVRSTSLRHHQQHRGASRGTPHIMQASAGGRAAVALLLPQMLLMLLALLVMALAPTVGARALPYFEPSSARNLSVPIPPAMEALFGPQRYIVIGDSLAFITSVDGRRTLEHWDAAVQRTFYSVQDDGWEGKVAGMFVTLLDLKDGGAFHLELRPQADESRTGAMVVGGKYLKLSDRVVSVPAHMLLMVAWVEIGRHVFDNAVPMSMTT